MINIYERSDYELLQEGSSLKGKIADILTVLRWFIPLFGISLEGRLRIRWLFWAFYFGRHQK